MCRDVEIMLEKFQQYLIDLSRRFGVLGWGWGLRSLIIFRIMRCSNIWILKIRKCANCDVENIGIFFNNIWATFRDGLGSFFLFMLCSNVNEQIKFRKCVKWDWKYWKISTGFSFINGYRWLSVINQPHPWLSLFSVFIHG